MTHKEIYLDEKAPLVALLALVVKDFGVEAFKFDPTLLRQDIEEKYKIKLSHLQADKVQGAILVLTSDQFETQWKAFETICHLANNEYDSLDELNPLSVEELIIGVAEANIIRHEKIKYSDDINVYSGKVFYDYGFSKPPKLFPTAIMPTGINESDDTEKNAALSELFDFHSESTLSYVKQNIESK